MQLVDPNLSGEDATTEVQYLQADVRALNGLGGLAMEVLRQPQGEGPFQADRWRGVRFEIPVDRLRAVVRRLCDRLEDYPQPTAVEIRYGAMAVQVETQEAETLAQVIYLVEDMVDPHSLYLAKAETYGHTHGELSPAEEANLELLRQRLGLSESEANALKSQALGPYQTLAEKRRYFNQVLMEELARQSPLSEETWATLTELAESLGLPLAVAQTLYQEQLTTIQVQAEAIRQQRQAEAEAAQKAAQQAELHDQHHEQEFERQNVLGQYREMLHQAMQTTLYPPDFDRGRLEQARRLWHIDPEEALRLEEVVRSELYGAIQSVLGIDYGRLRQLLWSNLWRKADEETENVILKALRHNMEPLDRNAILQLPCVDLITIDTLWSRYSQGRFGFKAQQQVYLHVDRRPMDFLRALDWRGSRLSLTGGIKPYKSLQFSSSAPAGHLPTWRWCCPSLENGYTVSESVVEALFLHLEKCLATGSPPPSIPAIALSGDHGLSGDYGLSGHPGTPPPSAPETV
ncbi:GUN4 domain-containing protein [Leptolyngbya sp. BL0902]|uniref:GUN4 domain-containing protein n=1 Tax=Leptolyngbya sp. BL0902 TaxID=1115757 RepID=UPI0018E869B4|nr:GUN4 domain-containing protein [Leptolyngbya sp. BL0902]